jgi:CRP-like cAMP-binding protein
MTPLPYTNRLLKLLSPAALDALGPLERITLPMRKRIGGTELSDEVYFMEDGVASVVADIDSKMAVELGIIGNEGLIGLNLIYGDDADPFIVMMQVDGAALQADAKRVKTAIDTVDEVRSVFLRYARAFSIQVATTALANGRSKLDERLARWLLMVSDRVGTTFPITHEFISIMLGVRRPGVTLAIQILEGKGAIRATRGAVTILDRNGLVGLANGSYGFAEAHYARLLGGKT